jgi:hypothetical protein
MRTFTIRMLGVIRYLRPDRNPLRRPVDRVHTCVITALGLLFLVVAPFAVAMAARLVDHAGLRAERLEAHTRHQADATVTGTPSAVSRTGFNDTTRIRWRDARGSAHTAVVPSAGNGRAGTHRTIWIDEAGRLTTHPRRHAQTVADTLMAALTTLSVLVLLHSATHTLTDRRLQRRRLDLWEREWTAVAPRWTGLP